MNKKKLIFITTNSFSIICLFVGVLLSVLNQYPNYLLMMLNGFIEGLFFYLVALFISSFILIELDESEVK